MINTFNVHITRNAQNDLEHIFYFIAEDNIHHAKRFILELEDKISSLESMPKRFALIPENIFFNTCYRHIIHKKYRIIYKISGNSVFVLRVIHGARLLEL